MNLAFIVSGKSPLTLPGGLGAYAFNLAKAVSDVGYKVYLIGFSDQDEVLEQDFGNLVHVKTPFNKMASTGVFFMAPYLAKRMEELARAEGVSDVTVFGAAIWGICGIQLKKRLAKTDIRVHTLSAYFTTYDHEYHGQVQGAPAKDYGIIPHFSVKLLYLVARLYFRPKEHRLLRALDLIVVHYDSTRQILLNEVKDLAPDRIKRIPCYIDLYSRESSIEPPEAKEGGRVRVNVVCRQDPRKGINTFLHALRILLDRGIEFDCTVAGSGFFQVNHKKLARRLGLEENVSFPGFVRSMEEVLDQTDIYVLPSVEEGAGAIALMEAMKKGVAILSTRCDGIPEDFDEEQTAILVDPADPVAMADALERLIIDRDLRAKLARNVYQDYPRRFRLEDMKAGVREVLSDLRA